MQTKRYFQDAISQLELIRGQLNKGLDLNNISREIEDFITYLENKSIMPSVTDEVKSDLTIQGSISKLKKFLLIFNQNSELSLSESWQKSLSKNISASSFIRMDVDDDLPPLKPMQHTIASIENQLEYIFQNVTSRFSPLGQTTFKWKSAKEQWRIQNSRPHEKTMDITFYELILNKKKLKALKKGKALKKVLYLNCYQLIILMAYLCSDLSLKPFQKLIKHYKNQSEEEYLLYQMEVEISKLFLEENSEVILLKNQALPDIELERGDIVLFNNCQHVVIGTGIENKVISFWERERESTAELVLTDLESLYKARFSHSARITKLSLPWLSPGFEKETTQINTICFSI
jgi:hypothetical protein